MKKARIAKSQWALRICMILFILFIVPVSAHAKSGTVKLTKKSMQLKITVKNGKTSKQSSKIRLRKDKSVKKMRVTYRSSNPRVAKVSSKGKVNAVGKGSATIRIKVKYKHHLRHKWHRKTLKLKVIVKKTVIKKKASTQKKQDTEPTTQAKPDPTPTPDKKFHYIHNPQANEKAMEDIIVNENAVYGFSPNPDSGSLKQYAQYNWTDTAFVASAKQSRIEYHQSIASMYTMLDQMRSQGKNIEEMARAISTERNQIRIDSYKNDPEGLNNLKARNLEKYGNENGPTPEYLYNQYGSWEIVLQKAFSINMGMDACCGLYDDYYQVYIDLGLITDESHPQALGIRDIFENIKRICQGHKVLVP